MLPCISLQLSCSLSYEEAASSARASASPCHFYIYVFMPSLSYSFVSPHKIMLIGLILYGWHMTYANVCLSSHMCTYSIYLSLADSSLQPICTYLYHFRVISDVDTCASKTKRACFKSYCLAGSWCYFISKSKMLGSQRCEKDAAQNVECTAEFSLQVSSYASIWK